jgi:hypothetical protein
MSLAGLAMTGLVWIVGPIATGQAPAELGDPGIRLIVSRDEIMKAPALKDLKGLSKPAIGLRPNVLQEFWTYLSIANPQERTVTVQLQAGDAIPAAVTVKLTKEDRWLPVRWAKQAAPGAPKPPPTELRGSVKVAVIDEKDRPLSPEVQLAIDSPKDYVDASLTYIPPASSSDRFYYLWAKVWPKDNFVGPAADVQLVLDPDRIPGYRPDRQKAQGLLGGPLTAAHSKEAPLPLFAKSVLPEASKDNGWVSLRIDNVERAFTFETTFVRSGGDAASQPQLNNKKTLWIRPVLSPNLKDPVKVIAEAENLSGVEDPRLVLEVVPTLPAGVKGVPKDAGVVVAEFRGGARDERLFFAPGMGGGLAFEPKVTDWMTELSRRDYVGEIRLRLKLLGKVKGKEVVIRVRDGHTLKDDQDSVTRTIFLDNTPPEIELFQAVRDKNDKPLVSVKDKRRSVKLRAVGRDEESGIKEVQFFAGRPTPEGVLPVDHPPVEATPLKENPNEWVGDFEVPPDLQGPLVVTVRFVNRAGLPNTKTAEIVVPPPEAAAAGAKKGSISGTVVSGDRPQEGLTVTLTVVGGQAPQAPPKETKTDVNGAYVFKDLDPNRYTVSCVRTADNTRGQASVTLPTTEDNKMDATGVVIKLFR